MIDVRRLKDVAQGHEFPCIYTINHGGVPLNNSVSRQGCRR